MTEREKEIKELEKFFESIVIPTMPLQLNRAVVLHDAPQFIRHNLEQMKNGTMAEVNLAPRLHDLRRLKELFSQ